MAVMGKPTSLNERAFRHVSMAPKERSLDQANSKEKTQRDKEKLLNKISGYKADSDIYTDGDKHNKMGKDEFLKLLTVQLKNQDPSNPMEQNKMAAELAQFSQLEQLSNLNSKFDNMNKNQQVQDKFYGASFLGKEVVTQGTSLKYNGEGTDSDILFSLAKPAKKVLIRVFDGRNNMVSETWKENLGRGNQTITWDGMSLDGHHANKGDYKVGVFAWDDSSDPIPVVTKAKGTVESVFFENGETVLLVEGKKVFLRDVDSFHTPGTNTAIAAKHAMPKVNTGAVMGGVHEQMARAENMGASKLPIANDDETKVNLNKINNAKSLNAYKNNKPTTGLSYAYDTE